MAACPNAEVLTRLAKRSSRPRDYTAQASHCHPRTPFEPALDERGQRLVWLEPSVVNKLRHLRGPGESFSDAIMRLAEDVVAARGRVHFVLEMFSRSCTLRDHG